MWKLWTQIEEIKMEEFDWWKGQGGRIALGCSRNVEELKFGRWGIKRNVFSLFFQVYMCSCRFRCIACSTAWSKRFGQWNVEFLSGYWHKGLWETWMSQTIMPSSFLVVPKHLLYLVWFTLKHVTCHLHSDSNSSCILVSCFCSEADVKKMYQFTGPL